MIFGSAEPLECYSAHLLLSKDDLYFTVLEAKGSYSVYGPRSAIQVCYSFFYGLMLLTNKVIICSFFKWIFLVRWFCAAMIISVY